METRNEIAAIVVTYNRSDMLVKCIDKLLAQTVTCDILVVDNNSSDNTKEVLQHYINDKQILYYHLDKNIGGAGGFNYGLKLAVKQGYKYVWIMDDDCFPLANSLEKLVEADKRLGGVNNYGYLSSTVLWTNGKECKMNRQKIKKAYYHHIQYLKDSIIQVEQSTFVSLLIPAQSINKVGLPIKEFFIWGDDIEYTRRMTVRNKMNCYMVGNSQVVHAMKENNGSSISKDDLKRINRYKYAFRNEAYLYRKEGIRGIVYYLAKCGLNLFRIIFKAKNYKLKRCYVLISSMIKGLFFNPKIEMIKGEI